MADDPRLIRRIVEDHLARHPDLDRLSHRGSHECDFPVGSGRTIVRAIRVTQSVQDEGTRRRELRGLVEAMDAHGLAEGTVVTMSASAEMMVEGRAVHVVPVVAWLERV